MAFTTRKFCKPSRTLTRGSASPRMTWQKCSNCSASGSSRCNSVTSQVKGFHQERNLAELRGKRVNLGQPGSASRDTVLAVLAAHGIQPEDLAEAASLDLKQALTAIRDGRLDATLQVIGAPADSIRAASEAMQLRLLPLEAAAIGKLEASP